jgi:hypothetical protein
MTHRTPLRAFRVTVLLVLAWGAVACLAPRGIVEVHSPPYPVTHAGETSETLGDKEDEVFMEVKRARIPRPIENLAVHYRAYFPGGEAIRPGDRESYVKIDGRKAYKVVFRTSYIRRRKRLKDDVLPEKTPKGWTVRSIPDPMTGKFIRVLYGPVIPRKRILYLVEGDRYLYYIFMRADGDAVEPATKKFEELVHKGIEYK